MGGAVLRTATFIVLSSWTRCERRDPLRLVLVFRREVRNGVVEALGPCDNVVNALLERDRVAPAELAAQLETVERISGVLARPFGADLDAVVERPAEARQDHFHQRADRDQLITGD